MRTQKKMSKKMSIKKATAIYGVAKYSTIAIQILIAAVLSRILTPKDYGVVAVVTVFTTLFTTLSNIGLGTAVTQFKDLTKNDIQDIFTFSEYFSFALTILFAVIAYPIALFYGDMVYVPIVLMLTISVFFNSMNMVPNAILLREKEFLKVGIRMIVATLGSGIVSIVLAFMGAKYYSLVVQSIVLAFVTFIWNFRSSKLRFKIRFSKEPIKRIKSYSSNQFLYNIANYFAQNLDNLLTGKLMGKEKLAYYNKGYNLMRYPVNNITHVITPVLHPILSDYQHNRRYIYNEFVKIAKVMSLVGVFVTTICFWADTEIIICYYGDQWYDAVEPFKWLCVCMCVQLLNALFGSIYQSIGCTKQMLHSGIIHISISLLAIVVGAYQKNITTLAICVTISMFIKFFIETFLLIKRSFGYSILSFLKNFIPDCLIIAVMFGVTFVIGDFKKMGLWPSLFIKFFICLAVFIILLIVTKQMHYITAVIPCRIKKKFRRSKK